MELMLEIISRQKFSLPHDSRQHVFSEVGGFVGRDKECEWRLVDKTKQISRKHALISFEHSAFVIEDLSTNGIYHALGKERLEKGKKYKIEHGNTYLIGEYSIQARLIHKPDSYISVQEVQADDLLPPDDMLANDPLLALEQQDELNARKRLGLYSDLLGTTQPKPILQSDHTEAPLAAMPPITLVPEDWNEEIDNHETEAKTTKHLIEEITMEVNVSAPQPPVMSNSTRTSEDANSIPDEVSAFFRALGFAVAPDSKEERERIMLQAAELVMASVDGMIQALRNRADSKNELRLPITTMTLACNNPLKFSPTAQAALNYLLASPREDFLPPVQAMQNGFDDLHSHTMGVLAGARAAALAILDRMSPKAVEAKLDGAGPVRISRGKRLWNTYIKLHASLCDDNHGFAAFFLEDFARAYEMQIRTLHPAFASRQGDKK